MEVWNDWIQVKDVDGDIHWVHSQFVLKNIFCATIKIDYVDMREGLVNFTLILLTDENISPFSLVKELENGHN